MSAGMRRFLIRRLLQVPLVLFLVSVIIFLLIHVPEGGPADLLAAKGAEETMIAEFKETYNLNEPLYVQYLTWVQSVLSGSLGQSIQKSRPVSGMIANRLPVTMSLAFGSTVLAVAIALPAGYISAVERSTWKDDVATVVAFLGISIPNFLLGILLIRFVSLELNLLPITGEVDPFGTPIESIRVLLLPSIALGTAMAAQITRICRSAILEELSAEYVQVSRAKGLSEAVVNRYIVFRNALIPVITIVALQFGYVVGATVIVEEVFALPGLGRLFVQAIGQRDYPVVQAIVLFYAAVFVTVNLAADLLYGYVDPRIRQG